MKCSDHIPLIQNGQFVILLECDLESHVEWSRSNFVQRLIRLGSRQGRQCAHLSMEPFDFLNGSSVHSEAIPGSHEFEFCGEQHHLVERHSLRLDSSPRYLYSSAIWHFGKGLRRIQSILSNHVRPFRITKFMRFRRERLAIEGADEIARRASMENPLGVSWISID